MKYALIFFLIIQNIAFIFSQHNYIRSSFDPKIMISSDIMAQKTIKIAFEEIDKIEEDGKKFVYAFTIKVENKKQFLLKTPGPSYSISKNSDKNNAEIIDCYIKIKSLYEIEDFFSQSFYLKKEEINDRYLSDLLTICIEKTYSKKHKDINFSINLLPDETAKKAETASYDLYPYIYILNLTMVADANYDNDSDDECAVVLSLKGQPELKKDINLDDNNKIILNGVEFGKADRWISQYESLRFDNFKIRHDENLTISVRGNYNYLISGYPITIPPSEWKKRIGDDNGKCVVYLQNSDIEGMKRNTRKSEPPRQTKSDIHETKSTTTDKLVSSTSEKPEYKLSFDIADTKIFEDLASLTSGKLLKVNNETFINDKTIRGKIMTLENNFKIKTKQDIELAFIGKFKYFISSQPVTIPYYEWKNYINQNNGKIVLTDEILKKYRLIDVPNELIIDIQDTDVYNELKTNIQSVQILLNDKSFYYSLAGNNRILLNGVSLNPHFRIKFFSEANLQYVITGEEGRFSLDDLSNAIQNEYVLPAPKISGLFRKKYKIDYIKDNYHRNLNLQNFPHSMYHPRNPKHEDILVKIGARLDPSKDIVSPPNINADEQRAEIKISRKEDKISIRNKYCSRILPLKAEITDGNRNYINPVDEYGYFKYYLTDTKEIKIRFSWDKPPRGKEYRFEGERAGENIDAEFYYQTLTMDKTIDVNVCDVPLPSNYLVLFDMNTEISADTVISFINAIELKKQRKELIAYTLVFIYSPDVILAINSWDTDYMKAINNQKMGSGSTHYHIQRVSRINPLLYDDMLSALDTYYRQLSEKYEKHMIRTMFFITEKSRSILDRNEIKDLEHYLKRFDSFEKYEFK